MENSNRQEIYNFLNALKMKNNNLENLFIKLLGLDKLELKHIIMFKYYINYIIVYGDSGNLKNIYDRLLELTQNEENNKYKDYIFALLYYIIIEQKSYKKNNKKPVFSKVNINNKFKKYILSENNSTNLSFSDSFSDSPRRLPSHASYGSTNYFL